MLQLHYGEFNTVTFSMGDIKIEITQGNSQYITQIIINVIIDQTLKMTLDSCEFIDMKISTNLNGVILIRLQIRFFRFCGNLKWFPREPTSAYRHGSVYK